MLDTENSRFWRLARSAMAGDWNVLATTRMSARMFFMDFYVIPPLVVAAMVYAVWGQDLMGWAKAVTLLVAGLALWTLAEYLIHRFAFHHFPMMKEVHLAHHDDPRDLIGTPTLLTVAAFGVLCFWPLAALVDAWVAAAFTAGMMAGYTAYVSVHYMDHHIGTRARPWMRPLIRSHALHHHDDTRNFGVTTAFWDRVFGTLKHR